jgi:hypothetical protein
MGAFSVIVLQVLLAVLVAGLLLPAILFAIPPAQTMGPAVMAIVAGVMFVLFRLVWPRKP